MPRLPDPVSFADGLPSDELRAWVRDRLHERDARVLDDPKQDVGQGFLVGAIYPDLRADTQAEIRRSVDQFLREMGAGDGDWGGDPGDRLLRLVMQLRERDLADTVRQLAARGATTGGEPFSDDRAVRLAQTLAYLGDKMNRSFWRALAERDPERSAVAAFAGMSRLSVEQALGLLNAFDLDGAVGRTLHVTVRGLLADSRQSNRELRQIIDDLATGTFEGMLTPATVSYLKRTLPELWETPAPQADSRALDRLAALGHHKEKAPLGFATAA